MPPARQTQISDLKLNKQFNGIYRCIQKNVLISKIGEPYINIYIQDASGIFPGKIWDSSSFFINRFDVGDIVTVKGGVKSYNTNNFAEIIHIDVIPKDRYPDFSKHIEKLESVGSKLYDKSSRVLDIVSSLNSKCKSLLLDLVAEFADSRGPDAHGGMIHDEVLLRSLSLSQSFCDVSPELSREYLSLFVVLTLNSRKDVGLSSSADGVKGAVQVLYKNEKSIKKCDTLDFDILLGALFDISLTKESFTAETIVSSVLSIIDFDNHIENN